MRTGSGGGGSSKSPLAPRGASALGALRRGPLFLLLIVLAGLSITGLARGWIGAIPSRTTGAGLILGAAKIAGRPIEPAALGGILAAAGPVLAFDGNRASQAVVRRAAPDGAQARFFVPLNAAEESPGRPAPNLGALASRRGLGALLILGGIGCLVGGIPLVRRGSGWGTALLLLVPTALVVGGYLLVNDGASGRSLARQPAPPNPSLSGAVGQATPPTIAPTTVATTVATPTSVRPAAPGVGTVPLGTPPVARSSATPVLAWPPTPSTSPDGLMQRRAVGDLVAELRLRPRIFAPTVVEVRLADRNGNIPPDIARVDLQFAMSDMAHGASGIVASPLGEGRYGVETMLLTMEGAWVMGLRVERAGARVDSVIFPFEVGPDAPEGVVEAYYTRPTEPLQIADIQVLFDVVVPNRVSVVAGRPVRLEVIFAGRPGCGAAILIPEYGITAPIAPDGLGEVTFVPGRSGRLGLECAEEGLMVRFIGSASTVVSAAEQRAWVAWRPRAARLRASTRAKAAHG